MFYEISIGSVDGIEAVLRHCLPLLQGHNANQMAEFVRDAPQFAHLRPLLWKNIP